MTAFTVASLTLAQKIAALRKRAINIVARADCDVNDAEDELEEARARAIEADDTAEALENEAAALEAQAENDPDFEELHDAMADPRQNRLILEAAL